MDAFRNQTESVEIRIAGADGNKQSVASASYTIRPEKGFNMNLDIFNPMLVAANLDEVGAAINTFMTEALAKAKAAGFPIGE
jgi:hypothetical protein